MKKEILIAIATSILIGCATTRQGSIASPTTDKHFATTEDQVRAEPSVLDKLIDKQDKEARETPDLFMAEQRQACVINARSHLNRYATEEEETAEYERFYAICYRGAP